MKTNKIALILAYSLTLFFSGCIKEYSEDVGIVEGYKPVYAEVLESDIKFSAAQSLTDPGKIYVFGNTLFVVEKLKGVHIIDNNDPANPVNLTFIEIPGNVDIAVRDNVLYADNYSDLVAIDVSDLNNLKVCDREQNVFDSALTYPNVLNTYFECVETGKGIVIGWTQATLNNPKCRS